MPCLQAFLVNDTTTMFDVGPLQASKHATQRHIPVPKQGVCVVQRRSGGRVQRHCAEARWGQQSQQHSELHQHNSRPDAVAAALLLLPVTANQLQEIYPGSKKTHFKAIQQKTGIKYKQMLFFDNEQWNCTECAQLGITCVYTPRGMTAAAWEEGLRKFAANQQAAKS